MELRSSLDHIDIGDLAQRVGRHLFSGAAPAAAPRKRAARGTAVQPVRAKIGQRYQNPANPEQVWIARQGKRPSWVTEALASGASFESLEMSAVNGAKRAGVAKNATKKGKASEIIANRPAASTAGLTARMRVAYL